MTDDKKYITSPEQWLDDIVKGPDLLCLVIFRGSWCKYDKHYLRKLGYHHKHDMKDVTLIAWTSEGVEGAKRADKEWGLTEEFGYSLVLGDETNALAKHLKEDMLLPDLVTATPEEAKVESAITPGTYANGIVMPAIISYAHHGNVVFEWSSKCEHPGYGGPSRPDPLAFWEEVTKRKHALDNGNAVMPSRGTKVKMCTTDLEVTLSSCAIL